MKIITRLGIVSASVLLLTLGGLPVFAESASSHVNAEAAEATSETTSNKITSTEDQTSNRREAAKTKLADAKLRACQNREKAIHNIMGRIADRGQKQLDLFSSIAIKTETFYTNKGKTLSNYDALVADVVAKKSAAQTTVDTVAANSVTFKCDGTDPKGAAASFKDSLKTEITALKDYKTAVKNLIVGVKSVQSTDKTTGGDQ